MPEQPPSTQPASSEMTPEEISQYLSTHRVLHLVHRALNMAVRDRAPNPLLHMARSLRNEWELNPPQQHPASPPPCDTALAVGSSNTAGDSVAATALQAAPLPTPLQSPQMSTATPTDVSDQLQHLEESLQSLGGDRLEPLEVSSEAQLRAILAEDPAVDTSDWAAHPAPAAQLLTAVRSIPHLLSELQSGESVLARTEDGHRLRRVVHYVEVELRVSGRVLVLTHEEIDGHARQHFTLPRVQLRKDETWEVRAAV